MTASNAIRARASDWEFTDVIRTPSTIGRVEKKVAPKLRTEIVCDWYQATMPSTLREVVLEQLTSVFGAAEARDDIPNKMRCYQECLQFPDGARFYHSNRYYETCCLVISGKTKPTENFRLLKCLFDLGVKIIRMDLAFDDRRGALSLDSVCDAVDAGNAVTRWKEFDSHKKTSLSSGVQRGRSIQFGSKKSASYLVAYDKGLETGTAEEGEWIRWELRLSDSETEMFSTEFFSHFPENASTDLRGSTPKAKAILLCYDASDLPVQNSDISPELVERFERLALDALKSRLSFRDRTTASNVSRAKQLPWWESFLEYFDPISKEMPTRDYAEYEGGESQSSKKMHRETVTRKRAEEMLTEIYEEHIRPHAANYLDELVRNIPEYEEPAPANAGQGIDAAILALVGLLPTQDNNVITFPSSRRWLASNADKSLLHRSAEVVRLDTWGRESSVGSG